MLMNIMSAEKRRSRKSAGALVALGGFKEKLAKIEKELSASGRTEKS